MSRGLLRLSALLLTILGYCEPPATAEELATEDGIRAGLIFLASDGVDLQKPLAAAGMSVHLVPEQNLDQELVHPAGQRLALAPGKYKYWLEGPGLISPFSSIVTHDPRKLTRDLSSITPVVAAGTVALSPEIELDQDTVLRLLHLDSHRKQAHPQQEMSRRVFDDRRLQGVQMPEGPVLAALYDNEKREYKALSPVVGVERGKTLHVAPQRPEPAVTDLVVRLERPWPINTFDDDDVVLKLRGPGEEITTPDVLIPTASRIYAVWYALEDRVATLEASSSSVFLKPQEIVLRAGKIEAVNGYLEPLPDVHARFELQNSLRQTDLSLEVLSLAAGKPVLRRIELAADAQERIIEHLPAEELDLVLHSFPWSFHQQVDLRDGTSATVVFNPRPIFVEGKVYLGDEGTAATISFQANRKGDQLVVRSEEDGAYEAELFRGGFYMVAIQADELAGTPPLVDFLQEPILEDRELDFHLPDSRLLVHVIDSTTLEGIAEAEVVAANRFLEKEQQKSVSTRAVSDDEGVAHMPPLRPGTAIIKAKAEGYLPTDELELDVPAGRWREELTLILRKSLAERHLRLQLGDGRVAAGAEARAQSTLGDAMALWEASSDEHGLLEMPADVDGAWILIRHREAGFLVRPWNREQLAETVVWSLPPFTSPLLIHTLLPNGQPAPWAGLTLWIDDLPLSGSTLAWLTYSAAAMTDRHGSWRASHVPPGRVRLLAWMNSQHATVLAGELDALAVTVGHPWPEPVRLDAVD